MKTWINDKQDANNSYPATIFGYFIRIQAASIPTEKNIQRIKAAMYK